MAIDERALLQAQKATVTAGQRGHLKSTPVPIDVLRAAILAYEAAKPESLEAARSAEAVAIAPGAIAGSVLTIEYDNDVSPGGGYYEWWSVFENGNRIAKCDDEEDAKRIVAALGRAT